MNGWRDQLDPGNGTIFTDHKTIEGMKTFETTTKRLASSNAAIHKCSYGYSRSFGAGGRKQQPEVFAYIDTFVDKVVESSDDD